MGGLQQAGLLEQKLAKRMKAMVGFRNTAVHDYQKLNLEIMQMIVTHHLGDFSSYTDALLKKVMATNGKA